MLDKIRTRIQTNKIWIRTQFPASKITTIRTQTRLPDYLDKTGSGLNISGPGWLLKSGPTLRTVCLCVPVGCTLTFACYIGSRLALNFNNNKQTNKKKTIFGIPKKHLSISPYSATMPIIAMHLIGRCRYPNNYQDYTLQPMVLTKINYETVLIYIITRSLLAKKCKMLHFFMNTSQNTLQN